MSHVMPTGFLSFHITLFVSLVIVGVVLLVCSIVVAVLFIRFFAEEPQNGGKNSPKGGPQEPQKKKKPPGTSGRNSKHTLFLPALLGGGATGPVGSICRE